jgi:hypothetical protein
MSSVAVQHLAADSACAIKRFATLKARAALIGSTLHCIEGDDGKPAFIVTRWALTKALADLDAVDQFLSEMGAR